MPMSLDVSTLATPENAGDWQLKPVLEKQPNGALVPRFTFSGGGKTIVMRLDPASAHQIGGLIQFFGAFAMSGPPPVVDAEAASRIILPGVQ